MAKKRNYGKTTIWLMLLLTTSKLLGLFRDSYIAGVYGSSSLTDVFFLVNTTITLMAGLVSQAINTCTIPILSSFKDNIAEQKNRYINNLLHTIVICSILIVILVCVFIKPVTNLLAPGFDATQKLLMHQLIYIGIPCLIFYGIVGVRRAFLQNEGFFIESGITDLALNIVYVLALVFISEKYGVYVLMISALVAAASQMVLQRIFMIRSSYRYKFYFKPTDFEMITTLSLIGPVFLSSCISDINKLIDKALASTLTSGALSALTYSSKINTLFLGIFITSITTVIFPLFSKAAEVEDGYKSLKKLVVRGINTVITVAVPSTVALMAIGILVVQILYQRGSFTYDNSIMVNRALFFYALALPGMSIRLVAIKAFYSVKDTKTPVINGTICIAVNIILNIILKQIMGYTGLALATAISSDLVAVMLLRSLYKKIGGYDIKTIISCMLKVLLASGVMGISIGCIYYLVLQSYAINFISRAIILGIIVAWGILVFVVMSYILKIDEIIGAIKSIISRIGVKK